MTATSCPAREVLAAYIRGTLSEDTAKAVDEHLPGCAQCNAVLAALEGPDEVIDALRQIPAPDDFASEPEYQRALAGLREHQAGPAGAEPTQPLPWLQEAMSTPFMPGDRLLARYEIRRVLGQGGMGVVYLAWDEQLSREVAVKVPALERLPAGAVETFLQEARTAAALEHPGIIRIYDFGRHEGVAFAVMEYVDGPSLKESIASQPVSHARAVEILTGVAEALHYAHKRGFIHRDLKPGNILMDKEGKPHIADFGLAIHESQQALLAGSTSGTAAYMAPEQARGEAQWLDGRADLWALGVILYEMLAGRRPFQAATASDLREEILHREPKPLRMIDDTIPAGLEAICLKCLSKDVKGRFSSARDLIKALRKCWRQPSANGEGPRPFFHRWCHQFSARLSIGRLGCAFVVTVASLLLCVTALLYSKLKTPQVVVLPSPNLPACPAPGIGESASDKTPTVQKEPGTWIASAPPPAALDPAMARAKEAVLLIQVEKSGQFLPFAACCALSENTVLTTAHEAVQLTIWQKDPRFGFKAWVTNPATKLKLAIQDIRVYGAWFKVEKPEDAIFTNLALLTVEGTLPKTAELAGPNELAQLAQGNALHVLGYTHEGDLVSPADHFEVGETPAKILLTAAHPDLPLKPRRLGIKADVPPKSAYGSPIVNAQGKVVAIYSNPFTESGADEKARSPGTQNMHYATVVNPDVIDLALNKSEGSVWVSANGLKFPGGAMIAESVPRSQDREVVLLPSHWGRHRGTPLSYAIEAQARLVAAQGDFLESVAIARKIHAEAYALEIQNSVEEVKAYFERRRINRAAVLEEKGWRPDIIRKKKREVAENFTKKDLDELFNLADVSKQLNWLLAELCGPNMMVQYRTGSEALPKLSERLSEEAKAQIWLTDGRSVGSRLEFRLSDRRGLDTAWPLGLRRERFDAARTEFESARDELVKEIEANGRVSEKARDRLILATNQLLVTLEVVFRERQEPSVLQEYSASKTYLRSLVSQVNRAIITNDRSVFTGGLCFQGSTILDLIQYMYQSGLMFAPPKEGGEKVYRDVLMTLRNLYMTVPAGLPASGASALAGLPKREDLSGLAEIKGLSGSLNPAQMDVRQTATAAAQDLMGRAESDPRVMPLFAGAMGGPLAAVCQLDKGNKLDGTVIAFQPGKDPMSCLDAKMRSVLGSMPETTTRRVKPDAQPRGTTDRPREESPAGDTPDGKGSVGLNSAQITQALQTFWADVRLNGCVQFKQGERHGVAATWDVQGQRLYWGNYDHGKRHDFCALFENNQPRLVAVFDQGKAGTVYLLSNNRVKKTFAGEDEVRGDPTALALLDNLNEIDARLKSEEQKLEKQIKATIQFRLGNIRQYKNAMAQMRMAGRAAAQKQEIQASQRRPP